MRRRRSHKPFALSGSHWRGDGGAKVRFASESEAYAAAEFRRSETGEQFSVYACEFCSGWHLGRYGERER